MPGGLAPAAPPELRWLGLLRDRGLQAILDEGLALAREDAESTWATPPPAGHPLLSPFLDAWEGRRTSRVLATAQKGPHLVVASEERHKEGVGAVLEDEPQREVATALEQLLAELSDAQAAVEMRPPEGLGQIAQRDETLGPLVLR